MDPPSTEHREVVTTVQLSHCVAYSNATDHRVVPHSLTVPLGMGGNVFIGVFAPDLVAVDVTGLPEGTDMSIKAEISCQRLHFIGITKILLARDARQIAPVICIRGNGRLASFKFIGPASRITGTVTMYGPAAAGKSPPDLSLSSLRGLTALSDVVLRAAGKDFPAHKNVLAARSEVFFTMFTGTFKESTENIVDVAVDCSAEVFAVFVDFVYSGVLGKKPCGDLLHLLELGERFMVEDLKQECVRQLLLVGVAEATSVLQAALLKPFVPEEVRRAAAKVIRENWQTISNSEDWACFCAAFPEVGAAVKAFMPM